MLRNSSSFYYGKNLTFFLIIFTCIFFVYLRIQCVVIFHLLIGYSILKDIFMLYFNDILFRRIFLGQKFVTEHWVLYFKGFKLAFSQIEINKFIFYLKLWICCTKE